MFFNFNRNNLYKIIKDLLLKLNIHPVLVDIGASGQPPNIWEEIAGNSIYLGFDPEQQNIIEKSDGSFYKEIMVSAAVTSDKGQDEVSFYFTKSPFCSSTLKPDHHSLSDFLFSDIFLVEKEAKVRTITLTEVMKQFSLDYMDWLKLDTQGTDLRLFNNLKDDVRSRVLAVDMEPGLINAYLGEDLFIDVHKDLSQNGFWLSRLDVFGSVRIKKTTLQEIAMCYKNITPHLIERKIRKSPGWVEGRYFRTLEWLIQNNLDKRAYLLLWIFTMIDGQYGFALDLALQYEKTFGKDEIVRLMKEKPILFIRYTTRKFYSLFSGLWKH